MKETTNKTMTAGHKQDSAYAAQKKRSAKRAKVMLREFLGILVIFKRSWKCIRKTKKQPCRKGVGKKY